MQVWAFSNVRLNSCYLAKPTMDFLSEILKVPRKPGVTARELKAQGNPWTSREEPLKNPASKFKVFRDEKLCRKQIINIHIL